MNVQQFEIFWGTYENYSRNETIYNKFGNIIVHNN